MLTLRNFASLMALVLLATTLAAQEPNRNTRFGLAGVAKVDLARREDSQIERSPYVFSGQLPMPDISHAAGDKTKPRYLASVDYLSTLWQPHRWGVDFVRMGRYLLVTGSESQRTFVVVDVADPRQMRVVAEREAGMYAARNLCLKDNLALVNYYHWINALDVTNPAAPEFLAGCQWEVDSWEAGVPPLYRFQAIGNHLVVACGKPQVGLRVYQIERLFLPRLVATVDLSDRLDRACVDLMKGPGNWYPNAEMIVDGTTVHTSFGTSIAGFDLTSPERPAVLYCLKMPANVAGLTKAGRLLYVAVNGRVRHNQQTDPAIDAAMLAVDVSDPRQPRIVGRYSGMDVPERMAANDRFLYLMGEEKPAPDAQHIDGVPFTRGLRQRFPRRIVLDILDVSNPSNMSRKARLPFLYRASHYNDSVCRAMTLDQSVLYLADQDYGVHAVDVSDPNVPQRIGSLRLVSHEVRALIPDGKRLYVVNDTAIHAADISDPRHPHMDPDGSLMAVARWGMGRPAFGPNPRYLYSVGNGSFEIAIADFGQPRGERGKVIRFVPLPEGWGARDLSWHGGSLFVLATKEKQWARGELLVYRPIDEGRNLELAARQSLGSFQEWLGWVVNTAFHVADDRLFILQAVRKKEPKGLSGFHTRSLDLMTVDIRDPLAPRVHPPFNLLTLKPELKPSYFMGRALAYRDGVLYLYAFNDSPEPGPSSYLMVYDVRQPARPVLLSTLAEPVPRRLPGWFARNLCFLAPDPYLAGSSEDAGAWIVDIRDPRHPVTAWKEPRSARQSDIGHYDRIAKPALAYQAPYLFVPRLDRVDTFQLQWRPGVPPSDAQRKAHLEDVGKRAATACLSPAERATLRVQCRVMYYHQQCGDLQAAEVIAQTMERGLAGGDVLPTRSPTAIAFRTRGEYKIGGRDDQWRDVPATPLRPKRATIRWQWDDRNLYVLLEVRDPMLERSPGRIHMPHRFVRDHVDLFVSALPASAERPYDAADTHFSVDLAGQVVVHPQNPRLRDESRPDWHHPARQSRAAVLPIEGGYRMEIALSHEESWIEAVPGARIACSVEVTDHGERQMALQPTQVAGTMAVQPTWPIVELANIKKHSSRDDNQ